jgi:TPR repeat protein
MCNLADMLQHGRHLPRDPREAVRLYRLAAADGNAQAAFALAEALFEGDGVERDPAAAAQVAAEEAGRGHFLGLVMLARCGGSGGGGEAEERRFAREQNNYAFAKEHGLACRQDCGEAVKWYAIAAGNGNVSAMVNLGLCFEGGRGVQADDREAVKWFAAAAEAGHERAMYLMGRSCRRGVGVRKDAGEAVRWFERAAERENVAAMRALGEMYAAGEGVVKSEVVAVRWFERAAEKKDPAGATSLALMLRDGKGVGRNIGRARELLTRAVGQGFEEAKEWLRTLPSA